MRVLSALRREGCSWKAAPQLPETFASFAGVGAFGKLKCNQKDVLTRLTASTTNGGGALTGGGTAGGW